MTGGGCGRGVVGRLVGVGAAVACALAIVPVVAEAAPSAAYVTNFESDSVLQFGFGADGALSPVGVPTTPGQLPNGIAISPDGSSVYVTNSYDDNISQYTVGAGGTLTPMATPTVAAGAEPNEIVVSPDGTARTSPTAQP